MAMGVPPAESLARQDIRCPGPASSRSECGAKSGQLPYLQAFICHTPAVTGARHSHNPGAIGPQGCEHHDDLYPCAQPWASWCAQPCRPCVAIRTVGSRTREQKLAMGGHNCRRYATAGVCMQSRQSFEPFSGKPWIITSGLRNLPIKSYLR